MTPTRPWDAVLFDLDGTLADTVDLILRSFRHTMRTHLGEAPPDQRWLDGIGTPLRDQLRAFARDAREAEAMTETYRAFQRDVHDASVDVFPGAVAVLEGLRARGVRRAVVTSKSREMAERTLEVCGLTPLIEVLVTADDVVRGKPDPEPVLLALEELALTDPTGVLFVGDSPWDVRAGRAAGVRTAAAVWGPFPAHVLDREKPDHTVTRLLDVSATTPPRD